MRTDIKRLKIAVIALILAAILVLSVVAGRWAMSLRDPEKLAAFMDWITPLGVGGWLFLFAVQYLHIVIALIPGGPIQIVIGALLGPWGGLALCLGGTFLATMTVFWLVSRFGHSVISLFVGERDIGNYKFIKDEKRLELLVLILFFIPGAPKDALTYLFALTKIKMTRFMTISTLARLPAMATSLVAGDSIMSGKWGRVAVMFAVISVISIIGYFMQKKVVGK